MKCTASRDMILIWFRLSMPWSAKYSMALFIPRHIQGLGSAPGVCKPYFLLWTYHSMFWFNTATTQGHWHVKSCMLEISEGQCVNRPFHSGSVLTFIIFTLMMASFTERTFLYTHGIIKFGSLVPSGQNKNMVLWYSIVTCIYVYTVHVTGTHWQILISQL